MNELIPIHNDNNGKRVVSARDLHAFLESKQQFADWIKTRIEKYGFVENQDFEVFHNFMKNPEGGRPLTEYALTLDCAKEISMVEGNAKGKQARQYFIACEKQLKEQSQPLSTLDLLELSIKSMRENKQELEEVKRDVVEVKRDVIEFKAQLTTRPDYFTIVGYGTLHGIRLNLKQASNLGRKATEMCKKLGWATDKIPDPRFGEVKMYPRQVLDEIFSQPVN